MSYNILAAEKCTEKFYDYPGGPTLEHLSFEFRAPKIVQEITQSGASVICL